MDMAKCGLEVRNAGPQASATPHTPIHEQPENDIAENGSRHTPSLLGRGEHCRQHMGVPGPCRVPGPGSRGRRCRDRSEVGREGCLANKALKCAMKLSDGMGGNPLGLYQRAQEPLGLSRAGRAVSVSSMPLKGTGEARGKPPRGRAWLRNRRVRSHEVGVNLRGRGPLSQDLA
jgi:hypothetical protein